MYNQKYYQKHEDGSYRSAIHILSYLKSVFPFHSVIDFGCGMGTWCKAIAELNTHDYIGIDQHDYSSEYMLISEECYLKYDLQMPLALDKKYDIAISVEVAEHIDAAYSKVFVNNLCKHSDLILFSAALPNQGGTGHINEQPCSYWVKLFDSMGYKMIDAIRPHFWDDECIEVWYRNNCVLFASEYIYDKILGMFSEIKYPIDIVHPQMLTRIMKKRGITND